MAEYFEEMYAESVEANTQENLEGLHWVMPDKDGYKTWKFAVSNGWIVSDITEESLKKMFERGLVPPDRDDQAPHTCESDEPHWHLHSGDEWRKNVKASLHYSGMQTFHRVDIVYKRFDGVGEYYAYAYSGPTLRKTGLLQDVMEDPNFSEGEYPLYIKDMNDEQYSTYSDKALEAIARIEKNLSPDDIREIVEQMRSPLKLSDFKRTEFDPPISQAEANEKLAERPGIAITNDDGDVIRIVQRTAEDS